MGVCKSIYIGVPVYILSRQDQPIFNPSVLTQLIFLSFQLFFSVFRISSQEHLGWSEQISTPGVVPPTEPSSAGLMSGRKQGFPPSLQEKQAQFDDTLECS